MRAYINFINSKNNRPMSPDLAAEAAQPCRKVFGRPWPDYNDGLFYNDVVSASDSGFCIILRSLCF